MDLKKYAYIRGNDTQIDQDFQQGIHRGKVKIGDRFVFWKQGLHWCMVETAQVERAYRRVEEVNSRICCGPASFDIQKLALVLKDGSTLFLLINEGNVREAEGVYRILQEKHPELQYGKCETEGESK